MINSAANNALDHTLDEIEESIESPGCLMVAFRNRPDRTVLVLTVDLKAMTYQVFAHTAVNTSGFKSYTRALNRATSFIAFMALRPAHMEVTLPHLGTVRVMPYEKEAGHFLWSTGLSWHDCTRNEDALIAKELST